MDADQTLAEWAFSEEDEYYDALNAETFGGYEEEENWEEAQGFQDDNNGQQGYKLAEVEDDKASSGIGSETEDDPKESSTAENDDKVGVVVKDTFLEAFKFDPWWEDYIGMLMEQTLIPGYDMMKLKPGVRRTMAEDLDLAFILPTQAGQQFGTGALAKCFGDHPENQNAEEVLRNLMAGKTKQLALAPPEMLTLQDLEQHLCAQSVRPWQSGPLVLRDPRVQCVAELSEPSLYGFMQDYHHQLPIHPMMSTRPPPGIFTPQPYCIPIAPMIFHPDFLPANHDPAPVKTSSILTEKDKQKLRHIQMLQLLRDHPPTTDYYHLMLRAKRSTFPHQYFHYLRKLYPVGAQSGARISNYSPVNFDNCLGRLHAVSSLTPRRVLDPCVVHVAEAAEVTSKHRYGKAPAYYRQRHLLLEIEKSYQYLLTLEEHQIRLRVLGDTQAHPSSKEQTANKKIYDVLNQPQKLVKFLGVPKGRKLVFRTLPVLEVAFALKLGGYLLHLFPLWGYDSELEQKTLSCYRHLIQSCPDMSELKNVISTVMESDSLKMVVRSSLGLSILMMAYQHAESLFCNRGYHPGIFQELEWVWIRASFSGIQEIIQAAYADELGVPKEFYPGFWPNIRRFQLNRQAMVVLEGVFKKWSAMAENC